MIDLWHIHRVCEMEEISCKLNDGDHGMVEFEDEVFVQIMEFMIETS